MLSLDSLMEMYRALKAHDEKIMAERPAGVPRSAWREENPAAIRPSFRVLRGGMSYMARINHDTSPELIIYTLTANPKLVERIDLRAAGAAEKLASYVLPGSNSMLNWEFAACRKKLGLTQAQLAPLLDIGAATNISAYERDSSPRPIPKHIARLMRAYESGWRPSDWVTNRMD